MADEDIDDLVMFETEDQMIFFVAKKRMNKEKKY